MILANEYIRNTLTLLLEVSKHRMEIMTGGSRSTRDFVGTTIMSHGYATKEQMKTPEQRERERARMVSEELADVTSLSR
jgi:hypothetical protein